MTSAGKSASQMEMVKVQVFQGAACWVHPKGFGITEWSRCTTPHTQVDKLNHTVKINNTHMLTVESRQFEKSVKEAICTKALKPAQVNSCYIILSFMGRA